MIRDADSPLVQRIIGLMASTGRPTLGSELEHWTGEHLFIVLGDMLRDRLIHTVCPEAVPGDSGRQFFVLTDKAWVVTQ